jgi:hypothetical protein
LVQRAFEREVVSEIRQKHDCAVAEDEMISDKLAVIFIKIHLDNCLFVIYSYKLKMLYVF